VLFGFYSVAPRNFQENSLIKAKKGLKWLLICSRLAFKFATKFAAKIGAKINAKFVAEIERSQP
jgi:hypothetical protein